jgi:hypothetical protein
MFVINTSSDVLEQFGENINLVQGPVHVRSALRRGSDQSTLLAGPCKRLCLRSYSEGSSHVTSGEAEACS